MIKTIGKQYIWGMAPLKPILTALKGKLRIRRQAQEFVRVRVKTEEGIREFLVMDDGDNWRLSDEIASITRIGERSQSINLK